MFGAQDEFVHWFFALGQIASYFVQVFVLGQLGLGSVVDCLGNHDVADAQSAVRSVDVVRGNGLRWCCSWPEGIHRRLLYV